MKKFLPQKAQQRPRGIPADAISDLSDDLSLRSSLMDYAPGGVVGGVATPSRPSPRKYPPSQSQRAPPSVDGSSVGSVSDKVNQFERGRLKRMLNPKRGFKGSSSKSGDSTSKGSKSPRKMLQAVGKSRPKPKVVTAATSRGMERSDAKSSSVDEMEYSSLGDGSGKRGAASITVKASQSHQQHAVGAAAMAVEYGVGEEHYIGDVDETASSAKRPLMRKLPEWEREQGYETVSAGDANGNGSRRENATANELASASPNRANKSCNDLSDLEVLGRTVQAVQAALRAISIENTDAAEATAPSFGVSHVKFHPRGCVWDASLHVPPGEGKDDLGFIFPIRVTCFAERRGGNDDDDESDDGARTNQSNNTLKTYTVELSLESSKNPFWGDRPDDVALAMNWVRRNVKRYIRRSSGFAREPTAEPTVKIRLPDKSTHDVAMNALRRTWKAGEDVSAGNQVSNEAEAPLAPTAPTGVAPHSSGIPTPEEVEEHGMPKVVDVHHVAMDADSLPSLPLHASTDDQRKLPRGAVEVEEREQTAPNAKAFPEMPFLDTVEPRISRKKGQSAFVPTKPTHGGPAAPASREAHRGPNTSPPTPKSKESSMLGTSVLTAPTASTTKDSYQTTSTQDIVKKAQAEDDEVRARAVRNLRRSGRPGSFTDANAIQASKGLISQKSLKRLSSSSHDDGSEEDKPSKSQEVNASNEVGGLSEREMSMVQRGLVSQNTLRRMSHRVDERADDSNEEKGNATPDIHDDNSSCSTGRFNAEAIRAMKRGSLGSYSAGEIRQAKRGLISQRSLRRLSCDTGTAAAGATEMPDSEDELSSAKQGTQAQQISKMLPSRRDSLSVSWHGSEESANLSPRIPKSDTASRDNDINVSEEVIQNMKSGSHGRFSEGEIRMAERGCMSRKSIKRLSVGSDEAGAKAADVLDKYSMGLMSQKSMRRLLPDKNEETGSEPELEGQGQREGKKLARTMSRAMKHEHRPEGEIRMARRGLMSKKTFYHLENVIGDLDQDGGNDDVDDEESLDFGEVHRPRSITQKQVEQAKMGLLSDKSMTRMGLDKAELDKLLANQQTGDAVKDSHHQRPYPEGEIRMARLGCLSKKSEQDFRRKGVLKKTPSKVSFTDGDGGDYQSSTNSGAKSSKVRSKNAEKGEEATAARNIQRLFRRRRTSDSVAKRKVDEDEEVKKDVLVFSDKEMTEQAKDILTQGQYYLGVSMLVYMYSHLRETCRMGHTRVLMEDIDVHSVQSQYKGRAAKRYLDITKSAGSIIRVVIDELEGAEDDDVEHDIVGDENKEYEKSITAQFHRWIEDSRVNQLDAETQQMIAEMKRKVARHRWKRAISAVRLSYKLSGGKRPKFENPVVAPGCENQNRFVDMNAMMSEAIRTQPKYFREGSVMNTLIESGIELVWFSDLSQHDVVYGICVQRELKKVTVVFRGTVNAHNWKMNLKFDTNEYRNPVKQNYPGRVDELSLHSGFALYLLRKRKDTGMSKLQEIFDKVDEIGREMAPDGNYKLSITGHSLGGALATLCGFYAAARSRFAHLSTIYVWTFAAPRVGTQAFMQAWQHLERTGRIRHARFSVTHDLVPLVPFCNFEMDDLQFYKHVGLRVQLHDVGRIGKWRLRRNLDVTYPLRHDWASEIRRVFMNNLFANLTTLAGFKNNHKLTEYQKRLHFAMTYRKALGSGVLFSDKRRNRIKSLDEYYHIRANITSESIAEEILEQSKQTAEVHDGTPRSHIFALVFLLLISWTFLIVSVTTDIFETHPISLESMLTPFAMLASGIWHVVLLPVSLPVAVYEGLSWRARNAVHSIFDPPHVKRTAFIVRRNKPALNELMNELAVARANQYLAAHQQVALSSTRETTQLKIFENTAQGLLGLAALLDDGTYPQLTIAARVDDSEPEADFEEKGEVAEGANENEEEQSEQRAAQLQAAESKLKPLQEYASGISFEPKLDEGLYLVGVGIRKKSIIKVYAVAMYSSASVLNAVSSQTTLGSSARAFDSSAPMTSFVLQMTYNVGAEKIAGAIAESVKPRHSGSPSDINALESLIVQGVNAIGGQATKGTVFRFDCSVEGVSVSVNGAVQGKASFDGLGNAFVDVFTDSDAVSPTLVESCIGTWSTPESKALSSILLELAAEGEDDLPEEENDIVLDSVKKAVESRAKPLQEYSSGLSFEPKLDEDLFLIGVGIRKKSIVKVYAVAMYCSSSVIEALSPYPRDNRKDASKALRTLAQSFGPSTPVTSFVLEMVYSASAQKIAGAIAESVKPRYGGAPSDVNALEALIVEGVNRKGGQANKGTVFRFDCSEEGVSVTVDGALQGVAKFHGLGGAFVDVFMDDAAVSPTLVESCLDTWCGIALV